MTGLDGTKLGMMAALTFGAACSSAHVGSSAGGTTGATTGVGGTTTTSKTSSVVTTGSVGAGGTGGGAPVCNPPAAVGSFWAQSALRFGDTDPTSMCNYRGDVLLVVNTADV
jgi:hypothetical protein